MSQAIHAAQEFVFKYPELAREWYNISNYVAVVSISNEDQLFKLIDKASSKGIKFSCFRESDLDNQITAAVFEPGDLSRRLCSSLPLALKNYERRV